MSDSFDKQEKLIRHRPALPIVTKRSIIRRAEIKTFDDFEFEEEVKNFEISRTVIEEEDKSIASNTIIMEESKQPA